MRALVLAAGLGQRLGGASKPLAPVAGRPLLLHVLDRLAAGGVTEAVVVIGHRAASVRAGVCESDPGLTVHFREHDGYRGGNGRSVLAAADLLPSNGGLLIMGDHLHRPTTIAELLAAAPGETTVVVDPQVTHCPDLAEATKVACDGDRVISIGKQIDDYDAIDTGLFWIRSDLMKALADVEARQGDCTVSDGMARLARERQVAARTTLAPWLDMDTPDDWVRAEGLLLREGNGKVHA